MCLLVIMCAVALIRTTAGAAVISDLEADSDKNSQECLAKCVSTCQQLMKMRQISCCDCISSCNKPCGREVTSLSRAACDPSVCDPQGSASRRSRRRPSRSPMLREAALIARSVGMDLGALDTGSELQGGESAGEESQVILRLDSLVRGQDAVTAVMSWDSAPSAPGPPPGSWYLVTWEPQGGGIRGNLLTNSTSARLTLSSGNLYHVQVSPASSRVSSPCLEVDTRPPAPRLPALDTAPLVTLVSALELERLGGVMAAVSLFLVVLLVSTTRWRGRQKTTFKETGCRENGDRFKLYPPPVTLRRLTDGSATTPQLPA